MIEEPAHAIAPENLPPEVPPTPKVIIFDRQKKIEIVAELIKTARPVSEIAAKYKVTPPQLRGWSNAYNIRAVKWLKAQEAGLAVPPNSRFDFEPKSEETRKEALEAINAGRRLDNVARSLGISNKVIRNWYQKATGEKLVTRQGVKVTPGAPMPQKNSSALRRQFSEKEKFLYVVRFRKLKLPIVQASKQLGLHESLLRKWVKKFDKSKPQVRAAYTRQLNHPEYSSPNDTVPTERKLKTLEKIAAGTHVRILASELGVHRDTIKNWWEKYRKDEPWPHQWSKDKRKAAHKGRPQNSRDERAEEAVAAVEGGELIADVAERLNVMPGTIRGWWRALKGSKKWPKQYGIKNTATIRAKRRGPNGPQKKTLDRISVREAVLSNSRVLTAQAHAIEGTEELNGHAQPISTGKATQDALVFLKLARDEFLKQVRAGNMQLDDAAMLFPMLALNRLSQ